eukprot:7385137-Pyramimonas_sp.AAC.1
MPHSTVPIVEYASAFSRRMDSRTCRWFLVIPIARSTDRSRIKLNVASMRELTASYFCLQVGQCSWSHMPLLDKYSFFKQSTCICAEDPEHPHGLTITRILSESEASDSGPS